VLRCAAGLALALVAAACTAPPPAVPEPLGRLVAVDQGELLGTTDGDVLRYRGIPYAAPPVGEHRFEPPGRPHAWSGTRPATEPGARCPQPAAGGAGRTSEDCLTVDVTVPAGTTAGARLPVLVWLHGGGFTSGAGTEVDPRRLALAGPLVVVTVNYRLGALGFLGLPGLEGSGSFGLLDQRAALTWVRHNITAFGGDPDRVTLAGQSAGADSVCAHFTSPASVGLFHRAIMQSGECAATNLVDVIRPGTGAAGDTWKPLPLVEAAGMTIAASLGCPAPPGDGPDASAVAACLRALPVAQLVDGSSPAATGYYWSPATGTPTLPRRPSDILLNRDARPGMPVLAGTTADEGTLFTALFFDGAGIPVTDAGFDALFAAAGGTGTPEAYRSPDRSPGRAWSDVITDRAYACPGLVNHRTLADRGPLYAYEFTAPAPTGPYAGLPPDLAGGAPHAAELPYLFDLVPGQPELSEGQRALADELVRRWARFATTGEPAADGATPWLPWTGEGRLLTIGGPGPASTMTPASAFAIAHRCGLWGVR
jgi:para-nitrobenzyl esterase